MAHKIAADNDTHDFIVLVADGIVKYLQVVHMVLLFHLDCSMLATLQGTCSSACCADAALLTLAQGPSTADTDKTASAVCAASVTMLAAILSTAASA